MRQTIIKEDIIPIVKQIAYAGIDVHNNLIATGLFVEQLG